MHSRGSELNKNEGIDAFEGEILGSNYYQEIAPGYLAGLFWKTRRFASFICRQAGKTVDVELLGMCLPLQWYIPIQ